MPACALGMGFDDRDRAWQESHYASFLSDRMPKAAESPPTMWAFGVSLDRVLAVDMQYAGFCDSDNNAPAAEPKREETHARWQRATPSLPSPNTRPLLGWLKLAFPKIPHDACILP
ncbi:hypothetical protein LTR66_004904 [Elasticomyces elasticus]|nr:hypothetical protein LTR50_000281 [Elasticomyces elasticus]KAK4995243.1 hypothetical protein LTR66_004904 [Elasticomyces elasticus]